MLILLVEDDIDRMKALKECLTSPSVKVLTAQDGYEAMLLLKSHRVDLIFSDVNMPYMSGYALAKNVKEDKDTKAIPFIMYSSRPMTDSNQVLAIEMGADGCISGTEPEAIKEEAMAYIERK
jgi:CheY-like chemotaxis protein